jgi:hypothetical protein
MKVCAAQGRFRWLCGRRTCARLGWVLLAAGGCAPAGNGEEPLTRVADAQTTEAGVSLTGDWVLREYVLELERTRDPLLSGQVLDPTAPALLRIRSGDEGEEWMAVLNFHEGVTAVVERRDDGVVTFRTPFDFSGLRGEHHVSHAGPSELRWRVVTDDTVREWVMRRVEPAAEIWASRTVLGGRYTDGAGRVFHFADDGHLTRDGATLEYRVSLDVVGVECPLLELEPISATSGVGTIFPFRRAGERVLLFDAGPPSTPTITCEGNPLITLNPVGG